MFEQQIETAIRDYSGFPNKRELGSKRVIHGFFLFSGFTGEESVCKGVKPNSFLTIWIS